MYKLLILISLLAQGSQIDNQIDSSILFISGASSLEELDQSTIEHYQNIMDQKIMLNLSNRSNLSASGLFTPYQIASILEYQRNSGDILSFEELSLLDGFNIEIVKNLRAFINLEGKLNSSRQLQYHHNLTASLSSKSQVKYNATLGSRIDIKFNTSPNISLGYYGKFCNIIFGSFASRFGQGLCSWSSFTLSGFSSIASFSKRSSGFATTNSSSASLFGLASTWNIGSFDLSLAYSFTNKMPIGNISWHNKNISLGLTAHNSNAGFDWRFSKPNLSFFGEICTSYNIDISALTGLIWNPNYGEKYALQLRYFAPYYKQYSGLALGMERSWIVATADFAYRFDKKQAQLKTLLTLKNPYANFRWTLRHRPYENFRNDIRMDLSYSLDSYTATLRLNGLICKKFGFLSYLQLSRKTDNLGLHLRLTYYNINNWDDRIYAYQQDAPLSFNVPAFYGRGFSAYIYTQYKINSKHSLYLRCEWRKQWTWKIQYQWKI